MQEIRSSNPTVVTGIFDPHKSRGLHHRSSRYSVISEVSRTSTSTVPNTDPVKYEVITRANSATFQINNAKLYVPFVTLSINDEI